MVYLLFYKTLSRILCNFRGKIPIKSFELPTDINQLDVLGEMGFSCFSALMRTLIIRKIIRFCQGDMLMCIKIGFLSDKRHETLSSGLCSED